MIDWQHIKELEADLGADAFPDLVVVFLDEISEAVQAIEPPATPSEAQMHFLKGTALTLGFTDLGNRASDAETTLRNDPNAKLDLDELQSAYQSELAEFKARMP